MDRIAHHGEQVARIRDKLAAARARDAGRAVFGSNQHGYFAGPVLSDGEIAAFEAEHGVTLPDAFAAFLAGVGNGGRTPKLDTAGPFYGVFPLGLGLKSFVKEDIGHLRMPCLMRPDMTKDEWENLNAILDDEDISDAQWEEEHARIYGGVMPLGFQGCTAFHGLVLNGPHAGRVVNLDMDYEPLPHWPKDAHFLDWYERWLDEVLSGRLMRRDGHWFGYPETQGAGDAV